jgi:thioredoxin-related protein
MLRMLTASVVPLLLLAATAPLAAASETAAAPRDAMTHFFEQSFGNLGEELDGALAEGKVGVFIMIDDEDCPWCAKMKATIMNQPKVQDYYRKHFRVLHLDKNGDTPITDFAGREMPVKELAFKAYNVRATPVFVFVGPKGETLLRTVGANMTLDEFLWLGEFVESGAYKSKNFTVYKRERRLAAGAR